MPKFQVAAQAHWLYVQVIEAATIDDAKIEMLARIRDRQVEPIHGPGVIWMPHRQLADRDVTEPENPR